LFSFIVALLLSAVLTFRRSGDRRAWLAIGTAGGCILVMAAAVGVLGRGWLSDQLDRGDSMRFQLWSENLERIAQRPWFGHGATALDRMPLRDGEIGTHAHNLFLSQAYYGGAVGLGLWVAVVVLAVRVGVIALRARGELLPLVPVIYLLLIGTVDIGSVVVDVQPEWLFVWVVLGIALAYDTDPWRRAINSR
jgi:O-antigen ligase